MKSYFFAGLLAVSGFVTLGTNVAFADAIIPTVEIKSFHYIESFTTGSNRNTTAEVCGVIHGTLAGTEKVLLTVDPRYNPGDYVVLASPKGNFCTLVNSLTGRLDYGLIGAGNQILGSMQVYQK